MNVLRPVKFGANDVEDMVVITLGDLRPRIPYQMAFDIAHRLRLAAKAAARYDRANGRFWLDVDIEDRDLEDCPRTHRGFRRSKQVHNVDAFEVSYNRQEVRLTFDRRGEIFGYEEAIRLHQMIRRAGRRAKAWAGEGGRGMTMLSNLTDAEEDYRLNLC
jgi:hypothetical protein